METSEFAKGWKCAPVNAVKHDKHSMIASEDLSAQLSLCRAWGGSAPSVTH